MNISITSKIKKEPNGWNSNSFERQMTKLQRFLYFPLISMKGKNMMEWIGITWELEVARGLNIGQDGDQGHSYIIFLTAWIPRIRLFEEYNPLAF